MKNKYHRMITLVRQILSKIHVPFYLHTKSKRTFSVRPHIIMLVLTPHELKKIRVICWMVGSVNRNCNPITLENHSLFYNTTKGIINVKWHLTACDNRTIHRNNISWENICRIWCPMIWGLSSNFILFISLFSQALLHQDVGRLWHEITSCLCSCNMVPSNES